MSSDPAEIVPANDSGADTLARFRYQTAVTLPYCVLCAVEADIAKVIPEHLEDIAIQHSAGWRFIQVKSRNQERGPWRLSEVLSPQGGALRSLYRTHRQTHGVDATLELLLEGATRPGDLIRELLPNGNRTNPELVSTVAGRLEISHADAATFLSRVVLRHPPATQQTAAATNRDLLHGQAPMLPRADLLALESSLLSRIESAMRAEPLGDSWPTYVLHPDQAPNSAQAALSAKTLDREELRTLLAPLAEPPKALLRRTTSASGHAASNLERKLLRAGADPALIAHARGLRIAALARREAHRASDIFQHDRQLEDTQERLLIQANGTRSVHLGQERPAGRIWNELAPRLLQHAQAIDVSGLFSGDGTLLLGELCEITDCCDFDWGVDDA